MRTREHGGGRLTIPVDEKFLWLIVLHFMANEGSIQRIGQIWSVRLLSPAGQKRKRGIRGIIGADGTHIPILAPHHMPNAYVNRKWFHSISVQAVCDDTMFFTDIYAGWPGSVDDAKVFVNSPLGQSLREQPHPQCPGETFLIGNAAYPLYASLLTPFRDTGRLTQDQKNYNFVHSSSRMVIERAFGLLKGRFRRLKLMEVTAIEECVQVITAIFVVHNICLISEDEEIEEFIDNDNSEDADSTVCLASTPGLRSENTAGSLRRQAVVDSLWCHI
ncbi:PREDICTED: LOW QUALITY PROTEIN: putative nuclease HARBI1 [Priapulus caudatus]|uniref:LOW QUALITY PROTEIN: putative nuclease HARBI1 n=1 Tax=Priapulus caudatus TaxID=37621 RepID=A0ABM1E770_PRICU|nr:PREDICTED: LOW QUALITY PROTEIN: putative nuclease HARBI1 [Priapulus caudatus]